jgi:transketolase
VVPEVDGHDPDAVKRAIAAARGNAGEPSLICCKTMIGWGSPGKQGKASSHGAALGEDEVALVRETIGWPHAPFHIPDDIGAAWDAKSHGQSLEDAWTQRFEAFGGAYPALAAEFERRLGGALPEDWNADADAFIDQVQKACENIASRKASQNALEGYAPVLPELIGGSADLTGSNLTLHSGSRAVSAAPDDGNYIYFGVREFAMSALMNGLALHGGFIPYGATFLTFSDYARNALRMAALMGIRSIFVYTHDSIGLGEDGPTHQAVEQAATLRLIPNMSVWRPCDAVESAIAWRHAIERGDGPTSLLFSRQGLAHQSRSAEQLAGAARGAYVLRDCADTPRALILATGSEVGMAVEASEILAHKGIAVRVVSMPSTDVFDAQSPAYRESVLPAAVKARASVEAGVTDCWYKYIGDHGRAVGVDTFGLSAPYEKVYEHFGLTAKNVASAVEESMASIAGETAGVAAE